MAIGDGKFRSLKKDIYLQAILKSCIFPSFVQEFINGDFDYRRDLDHWFCSEEREIYFLKASEPFEMPGYLKGVSHKVSRKWGQRAIFTNRKLVVRVDKTLPNFVEVELLEKKELEQVFVLTKEEWSQIKDKVYVSFHVHLDTDPGILKNILKFHETFIKEQLGCKLKIRGKR